MMKKQPDIKKICALVRANHGTIAEAARVTGVSRSYFSRVLSDDLKPRAVHPDILEKLFKGLTVNQRERFETGEPEKTESPQFTDREIAQWVKKLSPSQKEGLQTIINMIP